MLENGLTPIIQQLCGPSLEQLVLYEFGVDDEEMAAATACFASLTALEELSVDGNPSWLGLEAYDSPSCCDAQLGELFPSFA